MNEEIKILPNFKKFNNYINSVKEKTNPIMLSGLTDVAKVHFAYSTFFYVEKPICIITYNEMQAKKLINDLKYYSKDIEYFPRREILFYDYLAESKDNSFERIKCLNNIYTKKANIVVTTIEAAMQEIISKDSLYKNIFELKENDTINLDEIKEKLNDLGYERVDLVENLCQYSVRGGIIDIAISERRGVRIELFGDEIDSIREFELENQRSNNVIKKVIIYPATEFVLEDSIENIVKRVPQENEEDIAEIKDKNYINKIDKYFNYFYSNKETIIDYLKDDYLIFLDEVGKIKARSENIIKDNQTLIKSLIEKKREVPQSLTNIRNYIEFIESIKPLQTVYLEKQDIGFVDKQSMHAKRNGYSFSYREVNFFRSSVDLLFKEIQEAIAKRKTIIIVTPNKSNEKKIRDLLQEKIGTKYEKKVIIEQGEISTGFECFDFELLIISTKDLFITPKKKKRLSSEFKQAETVIFSDLKVRRLCCSQNKWNRLICWRKYNKSRWNY